MEKHLFRVGTYHNTKVFVDSELKLVHKAEGDADDMPLYLERTADGIYPLVLIDSATKYITRLNDDITVELGSAPTTFDSISNSDGTLTIKQGNKFLSARKPSGFSFMPKNLEWEHFTLTAFKLERNKIFIVRTFHGTKVFLDDKSHLRHREHAASGDFPVYTCNNVDEFSLFVFKDNAVKFIRAVDKRGVALLDEGRCTLEVKRNDSDGSIAIRQDARFWSAVKDSGAFTLVGDNQSWEHFFCERAFMKAPEKTEAVLVILSADALERILARVNLERLNVKSVLIDGLSPDAMAELAAEKKFPIKAAREINRMATDERESLWLMGGGTSEARGRISEHLQSRGIARGRIVDLELKMSVSPTWFANLSAAAAPCDFIVVGDGQTALGLDLEELVGHKGINLAAEGQDIHQSYLITKHVLERNQSLKFVLLGLCEESLRSADEEYYSECGAECRYVLSTRGGGE